jgi:squalene-hopene/tetraprenyl-beta-curcumene cyclase
MSTVRIVASGCAALVALLIGSLGAQQRSVPPGDRDAAPEHQYRSDRVAIPRAHADEPKLAKVSLESAVAYLDEGAQAWTATRGCLSCHTNGAYVVARPALSRRFGSPPPEVRDFLKTTLQQELDTPREELSRKLGPARVIHTAAGLAEWDANVTRRLAPETARALSLMFEIQREDGSWAPPSDCWPPFESDSYHETALAAMAVATAPGWRARLTEADRRGVERLATFLRTQAPPHDYARVWLLRAAARWPDLLPPERRNEIVEMIWNRQRADGGWSIRTFAAPEAWGSGKRAARLRAEPDFADPASDGHQTGLALLALAEAGVSPADPRVERGLRWLRANQRVSGRWWTRSLNEDRWHFITFSGTAFAVSALDRFDAVP